MTFRRLVMFVILATLPACNDQKRAEPSNPDSPGPQWQVLASQPPAPIPESLIAEVVQRKHYTIAFAKLLTFGTNGFHVHLRKSLGWSDSGLNSLLNTLMIWPACEGWVLEATIGGQVYQSRQRLGLQ